MSHESYRRWPYTAEPVVYCPMISCDILGCLNGTVVAFPRPAPPPNFFSFPLIIVATGLITLGERGEGGVKLIMGNLQRNQVRRGGGDWFGRRFLIFVCLYIAEVIHRLLNICIFICPSSTQET